MQWILDLDFIYLENGNAFVGIDLYLDGEVADDALLCQVDGRLKGTSESG